MTCLYELTDYFNIVPALDICEVRPNETFLLLIMSEKARARYSLATTVLKVSSRMAKAKHLLELLSTSIRLEFTLVSKI